MTSVGTQVRGSCHHPECEHRPSREAPSARSNTRFTTEFRDGVGLITVRGLLDALSIPRCRRAVERAARRHPTDVVLDLTDARTQGSGVAILGLVRRSLARRGIRLWLAACPPPLLAELRQLGVVNLHRLQPSVKAAQAVARGSSRGAAE